MPRGYPKAKVVDNELAVDAVEVEETVAPVVSKGRPYRVFDGRANLIAQVNSEEEADKVLKGLPGGFKSLV